MQRFTRLFATGVLLVVLAGVFQASTGCHDDSTGCCRICPTGMCACGDSCIDCTTKCMMGSGCACNAMLPSAAPGYAAPAAATPTPTMSESPTPAGEPDAGG